MVAASLAASVLLAIDPALADGAAGLVVPSLAMWLGFIGAPVLVSRRRGTGRLSIDFGFSTRWRDVVVRDDHAHTQPRQWKEAACKIIGHANAAMRRRISGQRARMQRDPRPRDPLHERHRRVVINVRVVLFLLLQDAVHTDRGFIIGLACRDAGVHDFAFRVIDGNPLIFD